MHLFTPALSGRRLAHGLCEETGSVLIRQLIPRHPRTPMTRRAREGHLPNSGSPIMWNPMKSWLRRRAAGSKRPAGAIHPGTANAWLRASPLSPGTAGRPVLPDDLFQHPPCANGRQFSQSPVVEPVREADHVERTALTIQPRIFPPSSSPRRRSAKRAPRASLACESDT